MDLPTAATLTHRLMADHGLTANGWSFAWNHGRRTLGLCRYTGKKIELSVHYVLRNGEESVRDTILHEIAHALAGHRAGHGLQWKMACMRIGAKPQRTCEYAEMPKGKWKATCAGCSVTHHRHKQPAAGATYHCRSCGAIKGRLVFAA
jgi:predicted SprT family Zn-dependent metalloprotease